MAIANNNVQNVSFLRNQAPYASKEAAKTALENNKANSIDGSAILARYSGGTFGESDFFIHTLVGFVAVSATDGKYLTIIDVEGSEADVDALREQMNKTFGTGVTTANTATDQFAALSGTSADDSGTTSVWGAKAYADGLIATLDGGVTAETGYYVASVSEVDGKISGTTAALPSVDAISENGKAITAVSESNGTISATAGTIDAQYVTTTGFTAGDVQGALEEVNNNIGIAISGLDVSDEAVAGEYVSQVSETDGKISVSRTALPSVNGTPEAKKFVISVSEDKGTVSDAKGSITSSGKTIVLTDNTDGGVNFEANVDGTTIIIDKNTGVMSVASSALVQYEGDDDTIQISAVNQGVRTVSSPLTIQKVTTGLSEEVKEEYRLIGHSGTTIGEPVKIYKDSHIVSITFQDDPEQEHYQNIIYTYLDASGATQVAYVDISELVLEAEFASGVTVTNHVAHGVVDPTSEGFLTVGADGFKLDGVQNAINSAVNALDADESGSTTHITVNVVEADGVITRVNVEEANIANASDLAELSGKTITAITSTNGSIAASIDDAAGNKSYNIETDASKIKMSGFSSSDILSGISEDDSVVDAFESLDDIISENERVTAAALTDLDDRVDEVSGKVDTIEANYVSGVSVNGKAVTVANHVAPIALSGATTAMTASSTEAIVVDTDPTTGAITLGLGTIDCGFYE